MTITADDLVFARDADGVFITRQMAIRAVSRGTAIRIAPGVYAPASRWAAVPSLDQHRLLVYAVVSTRRVDVVVSHWSAAALHGLPRLGRWPDRVHVTQDASSTSRSRGIVIRHNRRLLPEDIVVIDGIATTSIARTILDIAAISDFRAGVVVADGALYRHRIDRPVAWTTTEQLSDAWERAHPFRGEVRASEVMAFGVTGAQTPLESVSRVTMREIGCPPPTLQHAYFDDDGFIGESDFSWLDLGGIAEADGKNKYLDAAMRSGRSVEQVLFDEKVREDRLRTASRFFGRWGWETAIDPRRLHARLSRMGLPLPPLRRVTVPQRLD